MKPSTGDIPPAASRNPEWLTLLVFLLDRREYALPVHRVLEVVRMVAVRELPEAPPWVDGAINFRGRIIPVVDLRARLGLQRREPDMATSIVITTAESGAYGLVADDLVEVLSVPPEEVDTEETAVSSVLAGAARHADRLILVLDPDTLRNPSLDALLPSGAAPVMEGEAP